MQKELAQVTLRDLNNDAQDLAVLEYLARRVEELGREFVRYQITQLPYIVYPRFEQRVLRLALYTHPRQLERELKFVGFVSQRRAIVDPSIEQAIAACDQQLVLDMARHPDLLSYCSLELSDGNWFNLVLFASADGDFTMPAIHEYASRLLAPDYYEWIRLHFGEMPGGLKGSKMCLQATRYYTFGPAEQTNFFVKRYDFEHNVVTQGGGR